MRTFLAILIGLASVAVAGEGKPQRERPNKEELIARFDTDGDGKLSEAERAAAREQFEKRRGDLDGKRGNVRAKVLERFDADGDGKLSEAEREAAKQAFHQKHPEAAERLKELRGKFDTDGDGQLNEEERAALRERICKHRGPHGPRGKRPGKNGE